MKLSHEQIETNPWLMIVLIVLVVSVGGLVQIVPLFFQRSTTEPLPGMTPPSALQVAGRDIFVREGCYNCHSQMVRPFRAETLRYGPYSVAGESVWDHRTWPVSAAATATTGTVPTCTTRVTWCPSPTCPPTPGWKRPRSTRAASSVT